MKSIPFGRLTGAGFLGFLAMYLIATSGSAVLGVRDHDLAAVLGGLFSPTVRPEIGSYAWFAGLATMILFHVLVFPLLYYYVDSSTENREGKLSHRLLAGKLGLGWALFLWALMEAVVKPLTGTGFFSSNTSKPVAASMLTLLQVLAYCVVFTQMLRLRRTEKEELQREAA